MRVCTLFDRLYIIHTSPARDFLISLWPQIDCNASAARPAVNRFLFRELLRPHMLPVPSLLVPTAAPRVPLTVLYWRKYLTGDGSQGCKHYFYTSPLTHDALTDAGPHTGTVT